LVEYFFKSFEYTSIAKMQQVFDRHLHVSIDSEYIYSIYMMIRYINENRNKVKKRRFYVKRLAKQLDNAAWRDDDSTESSRNSPMHSPRDVVENPIKFHDDAERILRCNLGYPIILVKNANGNGYSIVDGYHRVMKSVITNCRFIYGYILNQDQMNKFILARNDEDGEQQVRKWSKQNIDNLYSSTFHR
jgi:hypothetical protein